MQPSVKRNLLYYLLILGNEKIFDIDINARIFPNSTAILEMTET
jgi:hypothetical protein